MALARSGVPGGPPGLPPGLGGDPGDGHASEANHAELRQEILGRIGEQVKKLILEAKRDSEAKVKTELKLVNDAMQEMDARLDMLIKQLDEFEDSPAEVLEQHTAIKALAKVEQQWGKELGKLKLELHQTIYAHNHNADILKHQKEALDQLRAEIDGQKFDNSVERIKVAKAQLANIDVLYKAQKGKKLEPLFQRLASVEQRVVAAWRWQAMGGGIRAPGLAATAPAVGAKAASFFPEEPEDDKSTEKPAFRRPTDEEVQAQIAKFAASKADAESGEAHASS